MAFRPLLLLLLLGITTCASVEASQGRSVNHFPLACEEENLKTFITRPRQYNPRDGGPAQPSYITIRRLDRSTSTPKRLFYSCGDHFEIGVQLPFKGGKIVLLQALWSGTAKATGQFSIQYQPDGWRLLNCQTATYHARLYLRTHRSTASKVPRGEDQRVCTVGSPNPAFGSCKENGINECCVAEEVLDCQVVSQGITCYCDPGCFEFGDCCRDINEIQCNCDATLPAVTLTIAPERISSFYATTEIQAVYPGAPIALICKAQGVPLPMVQWMRDGKVIQTDHNINITAEEVNANNPTNFTTILTIKEMSRDYAGVYACSASNSAGNTSKDQFLPLCDVAVTPEVQNVSEGGDIQLTCQCAPPGSQVFWKHRELGGEDTNISSSNNMTVLEISNIKYQDSGTYSCTVVTGKFTSVVLAEVRVQVPPQVQIGGDNTTDEASEINLHCSASGFPLPTISWFRITGKNGVVIALSNGSSPRVKVRAILNSATPKNPPTVVSMLTVEKPYNADGGEYVCRAENYLVQRTAISLSINVTVSVKDECQDSDGPRCHNGGECLDGYGRFFCQCDGRFSGPTCREDLEQLPKPPEIVQQPQSVQAVLHQKVNLTCIATGNPAPRYLWRKDGEVIEGLGLPFLYIHDVRPSDRAFYTCEAYNSEGRATSEIAHLSIPGVYQYAVLIVLPAIIGRDSAKNFNEMVAIELVGKVTRATMQVYSVQLLRVEERQFNLTLLITVVAEDRNKNGIADIIRNNLLQIQWMYTVADVRRYDGCVSGVEVPLFPGSDKFRYSWAESEITELVDDTCPCQRFRAASVTGNVARRCGGTYTYGAEWEDTVFEGCGLSKVALQLCEAGLASSNEQIAEEVARITEDTEKLEDTAITVAATIVSENLTSAAIDEPNVRGNYLTIIDVLLGAPVAAVYQSHLQSRSSSELLESLGRFSDLVTLSNTAEGKDTYTRSKFAIQVHDVDPNTFIGQAFSVELGTVGEAVNGTGQYIDKQSILCTLEALVSATASIQLQPSIFGQQSNTRLTSRMLPTNSTSKTQRLSYSIFLSDSVFQTNATRSGDVKISSFVVSLRMPSYRSDNTSDSKITVSFLTEEPPEDTLENVCADYNPHDDRGFGSWSSSNCKLVRRKGSRVQCDCSQPAHFGLLFDLSPGETYAPGAFSLEVITYIGTGLSIVCLVIVIVTYSISKKLRSTPHGKMLINLCLALLGLYIAFLMAGHVTSISVLCGFVAALLHYFILVFFGWTAAEAANLYMKLVVVLGKKVNHYVFKAALIVWLVPLVVVGISAGAGHEYYVNPFFCRATEWPFWFGLILPFVIIYAFDWIMFIIIMISLFKKAKYRREVKITPTETSSEVKKHLMIAIGLATVFGLGWGFGLAATSSSTKEVTFAFQLIFSIFVGFQGVLIFILHGLRSPEVRKTWRFWDSSSISSKSTMSHSGTNHRGSVRRPGTKSTLTSECALRTDHYSLARDGTGSPKRMTPPFASVNELDEQKYETQLPVGHHPEVSPDLGRPPQTSVTMEGTQSLMNGSLKQVETDVGGCNYGTSGESEPMSTESTRAAADQTNANGRMEGASIRCTGEDQVREMRAAAARIKRLSSELSEYAQGLAMMEEEARETRESLGVDGVRADTILESAVLVGDQSSSTTPICVSECPEKQSNRSTSIEACTSSSSFSQTPIGVSESPERQRDPPPFIHASIPSPSLSPTTPTDANMDTWPSELQNDPSLSMQLTSSSSTPSGVNESTELRRDSTPTMQTTLRCSPLTPTSPNGVNECTEVQRDPTPTTNQTTLLPCSPLSLTPLDVNEGAEVIELPRDPSPSMQSPTSINMERVDSDILPVPEFAQVEEGGALTHLDDMIIISNPMVNQAKKISQHMHQMSEYTQDRGKLQTKQDLIAAAKDIVASAQEIVGYARLIRDNCVDRGNRYTLHESAVALSTKSNILGMNASRFEKDTSAINVDALVGNTQELMKIVIQAVEAAESACLKGVQSPTGTDQLTAKAFAEEWKNDLYNLRRKGASAAPQGAQGLRRAEGNSLASYIQDVDSKHAFV